MMFLYPLGQGSRWDNNELRYSLRSLEKNFTSPFDVAIIGHKPSWLVNALHIPFTETPGNNAITNTGKKLLEALPSMPESFAWMSDDIYTLKPRTDIPTHHGGPMKVRIDKLLRKGHSPLGMYLRAFMETYHTLLQEGIRNPLRYDCHTPFILERDKVKDLAGKFDIGLHRFKTLYGNMFNVGGTKIRDVKGPGPRGDEEFFSSRSDVPIATQRYLKGLFPNPSRFEA